MLTWRYAYIYLLKSLEKAPCVKKLRWEKYMYYWKKCLDTHYTLIVRWDNFDIIRSCLVSADDPYFKQLQHVSFKWNSANVSRMLIYRFGSNSFMLTSSTVDASCFEFQIANYLYKLLVLIIIVPHVWWHGMAPVFLQSPISS